MTATEKAMSPDAFLSKVGETDKDLPVFFRLQLKVDRFRLKQYKKIADKIPELEYKVENPQGWLADRIVEEATVSLDKLTQKVIPISGKKKKVSRRKIKQLINLQLALTLIATNKIGRKYEDAQSLLVKAMPTLLQETKQNSYE